MGQVSPPKSYLKIGNFNFTTCKGNIYGIQMSPPGTEVTGLKQGFGIRYMTSRVVKESKLEDRHLCLHKQLINVWEHFDPSQGPEQ
jgi:hypothetical protein